MTRCAIQIVMGPAGSGKSTYCQAIQEHAATTTKNRRIHVANLDPAAEYVGYDVAFDIRELISVEEVMEELGLGPNGALLYCMEYLLENITWLGDHLEQDFDDDDYILLDCPGQLELYTHVPIMRRMVDQLRVWGYDSSMVGIFCVDATFLGDSSKFISGSLLALSAMIALELPHVNVLTKCDLISEQDMERMLSMESATQLWKTETYYRGVEGHATIEKRRQERFRLTEAICGLLDDYTMVSFLPLNITEEESLDHVLLTVDSTIQYGEGLEVQTNDFEQPDSTE